ncbi:hypothetical protein AGMMS49992_28300 [Clostridia bacterium]|nr:hypothetical protein AGMMS49992_28300 [Clostridia bacterium]
MKKRCFTLMLALLLLTLSLSAYAQEANVYYGTEQHVSVVAGTDTTYTQGDPISLFLDEKFNWDVTIVPGEPETLQLKAVTDTLPDFFHVDLTNSFYKQLKSEGFLRELPDELLQQYPNLWAMVQKGVLNRETAQAEGKNYSIPQLSNPDVAKRANTWAVWYRTDWAEKLGLSTPTTADEYHDFLYAMAKNDPDGNGQDDTYGTTGWLWQIYFAPFVDMYNWAYVDGQWIPGYLTDGMTDGILFWNRLYKEGALDPEFSAANARDMFAKGKLGVLYEQANTYWMLTTFHTNFKAVYPDLDPYKAIQQLPPIAGVEGEDARWFSGIEGGVTVFSDKIPDEKLYRILSYFDWVLSPEGRDFNYYGFEGEDWEINAEGLGVNLLPIDPSTGNQQLMWNKYSNSFGSDVRWDSEPATKPLVPRYDERLTAIENVTHQDLYGGHLYPANAALLSISTPAKDAFAVSLGDIETRIQAIITSDTPAEDWAAYVQTLKDVYGLDQVIAEVNAKAVELGITP